MQISIMVPKGIWVLVLFTGHTIIFMTVNYINFKIIKGTMEGFHCEFPISLWSTTLLMPLH